MQAVVMAGGKGTRLRPLTCDLPKPMVPLANAPMMEHIMRLLHGQGFADVAVTMCYLPEVIENHFGGGQDLGMDIRYYREEVPLGTAGSVKNAAEVLQETFVVISGDALTDFDLRAAVEFHRSRGALVTLVLARVATPLEYGVVIIDKNNQVRRFLEKPAWGEVFSDTVNTGIYVLEPEVLRYCPDGEPFDFSKDLFPLLMKEGKPLYGYVADGYWSDIGSLKQYRQAHYDLLQGKVSLPLPVKVRQDDVRVGRGTQISPQATIHPPVLIGRDCRIEAEAVVGPYTVLGDRVTVRRGAAVQRSVIWDDVYIDHLAELHGCVVCRGGVIRHGGRVQEGAVVGERSEVGEGARVRSQVKVWPGKRVENGLDLPTSLVWGEKWTRSLFAGNGVTGTTNVDITAETACRLGAAFGSTVEQGGRLVVGSGSSRSARIMKRAFTAGVLSSGVDVVDVGTATCPLARYGVRRLRASGGAYVYQDPEEPENLIITLMDASGALLPRSAERTVENAFFREDFRRAGSAEMGELSFAPRLADEYVEELMAGSDVEQISSRRFRLVVDHDSGCLAAVLPRVLERLGCRFVSLGVPNGVHNGDATASCSQGLWERVQRVSREVEGHQADMGVLLPADGERIYLVDEQGRILEDGISTVLLYAMMLRGCSGRALPVPITASRAIEQLAADYGVQVLRTKADPRSVMEKAVEQRILAGNGNLPDFAPVYDALYSLIKLMDVLSAEGLTLSELREQLPDVHLKQGTVECPWEAKGTVMRRLIEEHQDQEHVQLIDGVKVHHDDGWALVLPDDEQPLFRIYGEAESPEEADALVQMYMARVSEISELE